MKKPELSLEGRVALVTGAAGGIGEAVVRNFSAAGVKVFLNAVNEEKLIRLSRSIGQEGIESEYLALDLTLEGAPEKLIVLVIRFMGGIDILVNCASIKRPQKAEEVSQKNWDDIMNINLRAVFFLSQAAGREMIKQGGGKIINISSQAGIVALPLRAAYCSSKGGVNLLTQNLAPEWAKHNINVNAVAPTFVRTPFTKGMFEDEDFKKYVIDNIPMGRMATPEEVAYAALFLASNLSNMITGHILMENGGRS